MDRKGSKIQTDVSQHNETIAQRQIRWNNKRIRQNVNRGNQTKHQTHTRLKADKRRTIHDRISAVIT